MRVGTFLLVAGIATAFQLPSWIPFVHSRDPQVSLSLPSTVPANRIAIIGAGAAGSSAAFWIAKAKERFGLDVEIDIFESNDYIGGRSITVQPYDDPELQPKELGASIFVKANKNLWRATEEFGLERADFEDEASTTGIWDGTNFVLTMGGGKWFFDSWWDSVKVLWRYGYKAPTRTKAIVSDMLVKFATLYDPSASKPFANLTELGQRLGWTDALAQTTAEYLDLQNIYPLWSREMVEAATRVNYGQNVDEIHALEGLVSMAASGASAVKDGNYLIFEEFVRRSKANVYLNTTVKSILRDEKTSLWTVHSVNASTVMEDVRHYRGVIIAAPYHKSSINLAVPKGSPAIPAQPYVLLHVTLLSTPTPQANPSYFGLADNAEVPPWVLTTHQGARTGGPEPEFNSLSVHGKIKRKDGEKVEKDEYLVKIFSKKRLDDAFLKKLFGEVGWVYRKEWDAYPVLPPTSTFPPLKLDHGLYYVNAFEPFISTMETETIASRNVVDLLLHELYNAGICKSPHNITEESQTPRGEEFVYGWDC